MNNLAVVVIPLYKQTLTADEELSILQCLKVLSAYKIVAIKPQKLSLQNYNVEFDEVISLDNEYFSDVSGYNKLMLSASFYKLFLQYEYMLVYQPDAFVFKDELAYWCNQGYDYIGAPWLRTGAFKNIFKSTKNDILTYLHTKFNIKQPNSDLPSERQFQNRVGNGGLSLRNVSKFHEVCIAKQQVIDRYNARLEYYFGEDVFWSVEANRDEKYLNIPSCRVALRFSIEQNINYGIKLNHGELPFACHAWDRDIEIWRPYFTRIGVEI